jgi:hypothetical protein
VYQAAASDPDTLTWEQAMADHPFVHHWREAALVEIRALEKHGTWEEVPRAEASSKILPGTWTFRRKRSPDGEIKKYKARFCIRGDLQEGAFDTYSPLVAWSTIHFLLIFAIIQDWVACSIDFTLAFVQAKLDQPVWIHLPRGFHSERGPDTRLRLIKSLYGLATALRLWFEHL